MVLGRIFPAMMMQLQMGRSGLDFADWFIEGEGIRPWQVIANVGKQNLIETVKAFPEAWAMLQPMESRFVAFLDEFLAWTPATDEEPVEEPPAMLLPHMVKAPEEQQQPPLTPIILSGGPEKKAKKPKS